MNGTVTETPSSPDRNPDESPFEAPEVSTGYPLSKDEQDRVDRLVEENEKRQKDES